MKIRHGFVSNSSSSSFIFGIHPDCKTFEDWIKDDISIWLLPEGNLDLPVKDCDSYLNDGETVTYRQCLQKLWDDVHNGDHKDPNWKRLMRYNHISTNFDYQFIDEFAGYNYSNIWRNDNNEEYMEKRFNKLARLWNNLLGKTLIKLVEESYGDNVYTISYSDNDSNMNALMEHGDFWSLVPHISINQH